MILLTEKTGATQHHMQEEFTEAPEQHRTKTELAIVALRKAVAEGRFQPGERLTVQDIAAQLGMSPTPVREAFRMLQSEGIIRHTPHHGVVVADLSRQQVQEVYLLRSVLEPLAVTLAVNRMTPEQVQQLTTLMEGMATAYQAAQLDALSRMNADWHLFFPRHAGSAYLHEFIVRLWRLYPHDAIWSLPDRASISLAEHRVVMRHVVAREADEAGDAMRHHILSAQAAILAAVAPG